MSSLSEGQVTELSAYLSSPGSIPARGATPTSPYAPGSSYASSLSKGSETSKIDVSDAAKAAAASQRGPQFLPPSQRPSPSQDPLRSIVIESDLRRQVQANILHHKTVGSYKGRRHSNGFPVRGQRTQSNAQTAKKLNRIERKGYATWTRAPATSSPLSAESAVLRALRDLHMTDPVPRWKWENTYEVMM